MKFTININQALWKEYFKKSTWRHAAIFEEIKSMASSGNTKLIRNEENYVWISNKKIIDDLPMLGLKTKGSISKYLVDLEKWGMIKRQRENGTNRYFYKLGENSDLIDYEKNREEAKKLQTKWKKDESKSKFSEVKRAA